MPILLMVLGGLLVVVGGVLLLYRSDNSAPEVQPIWGSGEPDSVLGIVGRYVLLGGLVLAGIGYFVF